MTPLEKDIEKALGRMVGSFGGYSLKWVCPGWAGVPDRICLLPGGVIIFAELKRPAGGKISALQEAWAKRLQALGFEFRFIHSHEDIQALKHDIERILENERT